MDGGIDDLQMAVTMIPAALVEQINHIITRLCWTVLIARQNLFPGRNHSSCGGGDNIHHSFSSAAIQSVVIVNFLRAWHFAAINESGLVGHLRVTCEPPLLERISERSGLDPG